MSITLQNLRAVGPGIEPPSLLPGQIAFNVTDKTLFVGDGSSFKTSFDGTQVAGVPGEGWFSAPLTYTGLGDYYLLNPELYSPAPTSGQILTYSSSLDKPVWINAPSSAGATVYVTTNSAVVAAPGSTTSAKISAAIGATPVEADSAIVTGVPGDTYQGLYLFQSGSWTFAAGYAEPEAIQVPYSNLSSGLIATTVQAGIDELAASKLNVATNTPADGDLLSWNAGDPLWITPSTTTPTAAQVSFDPTGTGLPPSANNVQDALTQTWQLADSANTAAAAAQTTADAALPKSGGTMTGDITFNNGQLVDAGTF